MKISFPVESDKGLVSEVYDHFGSASAQVTQAVRRHIWREQ